MLADGFELTSVRRLYTKDRVRIDAHDLSQVSLLNFGDGDTPLGRHMIPGERAESSTD